MRVITKEVVKDWELNELYYPLLNKRKGFVPLVLLGGNTGVDESDLKTVGDIEYTFVPVTLEFFGDYDAKSDDPSQRSLDADFRSQILNRLKVISYLPEELSSRIKDKRLLALGYAENQLKQDLLKYLKAKFGAALRKLNKSTENSQKAVSGLTIEKQFENDEWINSIVRLLDERYISKVKVKGNDLHISMYGISLKLKNFKVVEQEIDPTGLMIKFFELHKNKNNYELNLVMNIMGEDLIDRYYFVSYTFDDMSMSTRS